MNERYHWVVGSRVTVASFSEKLRDEIVTELSGLGLYVGPQHTDFFHLPGVGTVRGEAVHIYTNGTYRDAGAVGEMLGARKL